jgi:hypothetical protein
MARLIDVIEWPDQEPNDIVKRVPEQAVALRRMPASVRTAQKLKMPKGAPKDFEPW